MRADASEIATLTTIPPFIIVIDEMVKMGLELCWQGGEDMSKDSIQAVRAKVRQLLDSKLAAADIARELSELAYESAADFWPVITERYLGKKRLLKIRACFLVATGMTDPKVQDFGRYAARMWVYVTRAEETEFDEDQATFEGSEEPEEE